MSSDWPDRLHAFVDGQLSAADKARLLEEMERDPELRQEVCELHRLKEYVGCAFENLPPGPAVRHRHWNWRSLGQGVAALLLLTFGFVAGRWSEPAAPPAVAGSQRVILHVNVSDAAKFMTVLTDAERLASARGVQVEVVANGGGLDLVRNDRSPLGPEVRGLIQRHHNLQFVACNISINKQRQAGEHPVLIDGIQVAPSAGDYILRRMEEGWDYVRI